MAGVLAAITVPVVPLFVVGSAGAQDSSDLAAQVERIQTRRSELDEKLSILDEEANEAKLKLVDLEKRAATNQADVDSAKEEMSGANKDVRAYAVKTFTASPGTEMMGNEVDPNAALVRSRHSLKLGTDVVLRCNSPSLSVTRTMRSAFTNGSGLSSTAS